MQPRPHVAVHLPSGHGSGTISPRWRVSEAVPHSNLGPLKSRAYANRSPTEHYPRPSISILTMQNNSTASYSCYQNSGSHHSESASDNAATPTNVAPVSTDVPDYSYRWPSADMPAIGNSVSPQTAFSDTTEEIPRVARPRAAWPEYMPSASFMGCDDSPDAYQRLWMSGAEAERTNPCAPQTVWGQSDLTGVQPDRKQVPSGVDDAAGAWSHRAGDHHHAVAGPSQHPSLFETSYPYCDIPALLYMPTSVHGSTSQVPTSFDGVRCWMAPFLLGQLPSLSHRPRRVRGSRSHPDGVICDQCQKKMRPQSLKRHIKEVHNHIKRHVKSGFRAGP